MLEILCLALCNQDAQGEYEGALIRVRESLTIAHVQVGFEMLEGDLQQLAVSLEVELD